MEIATPVAPRGVPALRTEITHRADEMRVIALVAPAAPNMVRRCNVNSPLAGYNMNSAVIDKRLSVSHITTLRYSSLFSLLVPVLKLSDELSFCFWRKDLPL